MIEVRHLRSLVAIAESDKLATAAERVHLSQSALSHQIRSIEDHYGLSIFERSRHGLRFTFAGDRLLALAREVLSAMTAAERDLNRLLGDSKGALRIVLECHTSFDWLMPAMSEFRRRWPEVELDLVAGFHADPWALLRDGKADLVIGAQPSNKRGLHVVPLFRFEVLAVLPNDHRLRDKHCIEPGDLVGETLISCPVPDSRMDLIREHLDPAGIKLRRRTAELTIAVLQLVASGQGIAALPNWAAKAYIDNNCVVAKRLGSTGLWSELYATAPRALGCRAYLADFATIIKATCASTLEST